MQSFCIFQDWGIYGVENDGFSMNTLKILIEGYVQRLPSGILKASPSTVIVQTPPKIILIDPGANPSLLIQSLGPTGLKPTDFDIIFLTHYHPDHILNMRLFPYTEVMDGSTRYIGDEEIPYLKLIPGTDIEVIPTPGHSEEHASLLVTAAEGKYAIAGDVFWWEEDQV
jgi:glyoxylase-like metal-dependent hydrolase (beta-lactamase superfamily II)